MEGLREVCGWKEGLHDASRWKKPEHTETIDTSITTTFFGPVTHWLSKLEFSRASGVHSHTQPPLKSFYSNQLEGIKNRNKGS